MGNNKKIKKSCVLVEITNEGGDEKFKALAGTEDQQCANRALAAMKSYKGEVIRAGGDDKTLIHSSVVEDVESNPVLIDSLNEDDDAVDRLLNMVKSS